MSSRGSAARSNDYCDLEERDVRDTTVLKKAMTFLFKLSSSTPRVKNLAKPKSSLFLPLKKGPNADGN